MTMDMDAAEQLDLLKRRAKEGDLEALQALRDIGFFEKVWTGKESLSGTTRKIPLSPHQERLWFIDLFETGHVYKSSPTYHNIPLILHMRGVVDLPLLEQSLNEVIGRHEALRTNIVAEGDSASQQIHSVANITVHPHKFEPNQQINRSSIDWLVDLALEETIKPLQLNSDLLLRAVLFKLSEVESLLVVVIHHAIVDRESLYIIANELTEIYRARVEGKTLQLSPSHLQYADYALWQRNLPEDIVEDLRFYWRHQLRGDLEALNLPSTHPRSVIHTFTAARYTFSLTKELTERINALSCSACANDFAVLLTAFKVLLYRYTGQEEVVVGSSVSGRSQLVGEHLVGPLANLLVLRSRIRDNPTFHELLAQVTKTIDQAHQHQELPFDELVRILNPQKDMSRTALFDVLFQVVAKPELNMGSVTGRTIETNVGYGKYDINLLMQSGEEGFSGIAVYNADIYDGAIIGQMLRHFVQILDVVTSDPGTQIDNFTLLSDAEENQQRLDWNSTYASYPKGKTIHQLFEEQTEKTPGRTAVVFDNSFLTYRELNEQANQLAHYLRERGVTADTLVALYVERSLEMIVAILGILKAGGAYLPMDAAYPRERLNLMLEDAHVSHVVTKNILAADVFQKDRSFVLLDLEQKAISAEPITPPICNTSPDNLAYCIYTSGSTGKPKGVLLEHRNVVRLMVNDKPKFAFTANDVWTMFHSYCFDFSVWELCGALLHGGKLVLVPEAVTKDPISFVNLLIHERITILNQTPTSFYNIAQEVLKRTKLDLSLKYVIFGGEAVDPHQLLSWKQAYPDVKLVNMYGITECTVHVTFKELTDSDITDGVSNVGNPISTTTVYIGDSALRLLPVGVRGELYVGGDGLARGYLNRPDLTAEKFIPDPFTDQEGGRLYRTGDVARYLPNGDLEFLGRIDHQVKIRGFRIELGEVEAALAQHPSVRQLVVTTREEIPGEKRLVAYIVSNTEEFVLDELRNFLRKKLPDYMLPVAFVRLNTLPLTPNGKVDHSALPAPTTSRPRLTEEYAEPRAPIEETLVSIWTEILDVERAGIFDNFFELGGHSLLATRVTSRIRDTFSVDLPIKRLFEEPTIAGLAQQISLLLPSGQQQATLSDPTLDDREEGEL